MILAKEHFSLSSLHKKQSFSFPWHKGILTEPAPLIY